MTQEQLFSEYVELSKAVIQLKDENMELKAEIKLKKWQKKARKINEL